MKKILIFMTVCAVLFSCQKEEPKVIDPTDKYVIASENLPVPAKASKAIVITVANPPAKVLSNIELSEAGMFIAYSDAYKTKSGKLEDQEIITGTYTTAGGSYVLNWNGVEITLSASSDVASIDCIMIDGVAYGASASIMPEASDTLEKGLCRTWYPAGYHIAIVANGSVLYNKESKNIMGLQKDFLKYVLGKEVDEDDLLFNAELDSFIFTNNHTAAVVMSGSILEVCEWEKISIDRVKFSLNGKSVEANPYFKAGSPNTMYLMIDPVSALSSLGGLEGILGNIEGLSEEIENYTKELEGIAAIAGKKALKGIKKIDDIGLSCHIVVTMVDAE